MDSWPEPQDPSSAVTVWGTPDCVFVHVTVLFTPITTVTALGLNAKFEMLTLTVLWAAAVGAVKKNASPATIRAAATVSDPSLAPLLKLDGFKVSP